MDLQRKEHEDYTNLEKKTRFRLTEFSEAGGCGCKIQSQELEKIVPLQSLCKQFSHLIVGPETKDDAAVCSIDDSRAIVSTTDFFTPIVDDSFDFGEIAAVNAISDIYAMGAQPLMAISILGWPLKSLPTSEAQRVIEGAQNACERSGIPLCGGHSINVSVPFFGLAVTGICNSLNVIRNSTGKAGNDLFLTKPLGVGILTTALKAGALTSEAYTELMKTVKALNVLGMQLPHHICVTAMTDVTGFGLLGHLAEMCGGAELSAYIEFDKIPVLAPALTLMNNYTPRGTFRNYENVKSKVEIITRSSVEELYKPEVDASLDECIRILCDPQTSGGLLIAVDSFHEGYLAFLSLLRENFPEGLQRIGVLREKQPNHKELTVVCNK